MTIRTKRLILFQVVLCCWTYFGYAQQFSSSYADYYKKPDNGNIPEIKSRYDYSPLAAEISAGCTNDYDKIKAIYGWICSHIEYDTSYKIRTADECLKKQKGVCQAYCELFFLLAKAVGVRVEIIEGKAKDQTGYVNPNGHGWLFAYTRENHGILMDPTWGAGSVEGDNFIRDENCWQWFNVTPEWMILSHFPDKTSCQLLDKPMSEKEFLAMEPVKPIWMEYGLNLKHIYEKARGGKIVLPQFYHLDEHIIEMVDIPYLTSLTIGIQYTFRIKMIKDRDFAIMNNSVSCKKDEWTDEGNGIYAVKFVPRDTESLVICVRDADGSSWNTIARYDIAPPTQAAWDMLATYYPLSTPEMKAVKNLNVKEWNEAGITEHKLAQLIKANHITELPILFNGRGQQMNIVSVPMSRQLMTDKSYTFSFYPKTGVKWAIVNGQEWYTDWEVSEDGLYTIRVTPHVSGRLSLFVQMADADSYWSCLEYEVQ